VFGLAADAAGLFDQHPGLPIVEAITDSNEWIPGAHKKEHQPGDLPESLRRAIRVFIVSCAARAARGQVGVHNSMLVHVTRFTSVQRQVAEQIQDELTLLQRRLRLGDGAGPVDLRGELQALWSEEFEPTTERILEIEPVLRAELPSLSWADVEPHILVAAQAIRVKVVNGFANDSLEYWDHPEGLSVIAIGGDKLSRGLTLEGLDSQLLPARISYVRHPYADGTLVWLPGWIP
jgi:hypothetical protein